VRLRAHRSRPVIGRGGWSFADWRAGRANVLGSRPVQSRREEKNRRGRLALGAAYSYNTIYYITYRLGHGRHAGIPHSLVCRESQW